MAVRKVKGRPPRPARALRGMDDAMRAERMLENVWVPRHREEFRGLTLDGLFDVSFVSLLKAVSGTFALREAIAGTSNSLIHAQERAKKYKGRCVEVAERYTRKLEEAKARENELGGKLLDAEVDRDTWRHKCQEAESLAAITRVHLNAAEAQLTVVKGSLEGARIGIGELTRQLQEADQRADKAVSDACAAGKRAEDAEARAERAESWATEEVAAATRRAREVEDRAAAADERAQNAEARVDTAVRDFLMSEEFKSEMAEAATDAYIRGFDHCKERVAAAYKLEGLDAIQPSPPDDDGADEEEADKNPKPADE